MKDIVKEQIEVLCIYGYDKHLFCTKIQNLLRTCANLHVVFIEDDKNKYEELKNIKYKNITSYFLHTPLQVEPLLKKIAWDFLFLKHKVIASKDYKNKDTFEKIKEMEKEIFYGVHLVASDYADFGIGNFDNLLSNIQTKNFILLEKLFNKFENTPAIICGAGNSLTKNFDHLRNNIDKSLIFSGGKALEILLDNNILPHFAGGIDKEFVFKNSSFSMPLFHLFRFNKTSFSKFKGPCVCVKDESIFSFEKFFLEKLNLDQLTIDGGWNICYFLAEIACYLGCNPIIFVGNDLSYLGKQKYPKGYKAKQAELIKVKDVNGQYVYTQKDWYISSIWTNHLKAKFNETKFFNLSSGLELLGVENSCFEDMEKTYLTKEIDKELVLQSIANVEKTSINEENLASVLAEIKNSLNDVIVKIDKFISSCEEVYNKKEVFNSQLIDFVSEDLSYEIILKPVWEIWKYPMKREMKLEENSFQYVVNEAIFMKDVAIQYLKRI